MSTDETRTVLCVQLNETQTEVLTNSIKLQISGTVPPFFILNSQTAQLQPLSVVS